MKKQIIVLVALASLAAGYTTAYAAAGSAGGGIVGSKHDMNMWIAQYGGTKDAEARVCAYCHTPHHAVDPTTEVLVTVGLDTVPYTAYAPLWSRAIDYTKGYDQYNSATFDPSVEGKFYDPLAGPSRLCMSCHDGSVAADSYYGVTAGTAETGDDLLSLGGGKHIAIGSNMGLSNDHPIGFIYDEMVANTDNELKTADAVFIGGTKTIGSVMAEVAGKKVMTCASCHDVHNGDAVINRPVGGRGYFLLAKQEKSDICLSCHDKDQ